MTDVRPLPLATFWALFHARRNLRKRAFKGWAIACALGYLALRFGGNLRATELAELVVLWLAPLLGLFFGAGVLREEIEDQTITYSFTRPLGRGWIYAARVVAAMGPVLLLTMPLALLCATSVDAVSGARLVLAAALSVLAYTGIFALLGLLLRWSTWIGLAWLIFWEGFASLAPGFIGRLTLQGHLRGLAGLSPKAGLLASLWQPPPPLLSVFFLLLAAGGALFLGGLIVQRREIALEK